MSAHAEYFSSIQKTESLLLVVVCDIRGFTDLQARMDDFKQSNLTSQAKLDEIIGAYTNYIGKTQDITVDKILGRLHNGNGDTSFRYSVKSTGDGLMLAVELAKADTVPEAIRITPDPSGYPESWKRVATELAIGLAELVEEAKVEHDASKTFGHLTLEFLNNYGRQLGIKPPKNEDHWSAFRVAGAMAMGFGLYLSAPHGSGEIPLRNGSAGEPSFSLDDASGHPVNLAFRLCDKAGREECYTPFILVDRRVARILDQKVVGKWEVEPYDETLDMKGIEERWCFQITTPTIEQKRKGRRSAG